MSTAFEAIFRSVYVMVDVWWHAKFMVVAIQQFVGSSQMLTCLQCYGSGPFFSDPVFKIRIRVTDRIRILLRNVFDV